MSTSGRWMFAAFVCAIAGGFAAVTAHSTPPELTTAIEPRLAADLAAGDLRAQLAAVQARATTIAQMPRLAAAVATDAETVRDLTTDELAFDVRSDETIEIGQLRGVQATSLLRRPDKAAPLRLAPSGPSVAIAGGRVVVTHVVTVVPSQDAELVRGSLAVARAVEPSLALPQLAKRTPATVFIGSDAVSVGELDGETYAEADVELLGVHTPPASSGSSLDARGATEVSGTRASSIGAEAPSHLRVRVPAELVTPSSVRELYAAASGAGLLMLGCLAMAVRRRRRRPRAASVEAPAAWTEPAFAPTEPPLPLPVRIPSGSSSMETPRGTAAMSAARRGRYQPLDLLGEGGTSSVFLARAIGEAGFERRVALKVLRPELAMHAEARELFLDEARLASRIDHPNVVQILDLGLDGDEYYIAMEHIDGDDLESILQRLRHDGRTVPVDIALAIARRVCDGLHAAHTALDAQGRPLALVHRDVKPGNVLISRNGQVKVGDFGIAKATQQLHVSMLGVTRGTVQFMAPEQRLGGGVDARTDVFGMGALIYELTTCAELDLDTRRLLAYGVDGWPHLAPMRQLRPELPPELEAIVLRALAFDAAGRHDTCAELEAELAVVVEAHDWTVSDRELGTWLTAELDRVRRRVSRRMLGLEGPPT